jgi:hypothetical protein
MTGETESPFALSADEVREFAAMEAAERGHPIEEGAPEDDVAERDPEAAADLIEADEPENADDEWRNTRKVPFKTFDAFRRRAREAETKLQEQQRQIAVAQERLNILMASVQGDQQQAQPQYQQPEPEPIPDPEQDIFAYAKWQAQELERVRAQVQQVAGLTEQQQRAAWEHQQRQALAQRVIHEEQQFSAQKPDYTDAVEFVRSRRISAYEQLGMPRAQAEATVNNEALTFVSQIAQSGRPIAQTVYEFAIQNGFTPGQARAAANEAAGTTQPRDESGRFQPVQSEKLATVANAQARNKSLSSSNGSSGKKDDVDFLSLSNDEIYNLVQADAKVGHKMLRKQLGYT